MKKSFVMLILMVFFVGGCTIINNNPKKAVEMFFDNYNNNSAVVLDELDMFLGAKDYDEDTLNKYRDAYIRQYTNLKYSIIDSDIHGNDATVKVNVSVFDYNEINKKANEALLDNKTMFMDRYGDVDLDVFLNYKIDQFLHTNERVDYEIELKLKKYNNIWEIEPLTYEQLNKIHGTYEY